jgi:hypothetical protein
MIVEIKRIDVSQIGVDIKDAMLFPVSPPVGLARLPESFNA